MKTWMVALLRKEGFAMGRVGLLLLVLHRRGANAVCVE